MMVTWIVEGKINSYYETAPLTQVLSNQTEITYSKMKHFHLRKFLLTLWPPSSWIKFRIEKEIYS